VLRSIEQVCESIPKAQPENNAPDG